MTSKNIKIRLGFFMLVASLFFPVPSLSQESGIGDLPLTISQAVRLALENNNDLVIAKNDLHIARNQLRSARSIYDGSFLINPRYSNSIQPQPSTLGGADLSGTTRSNDLRFDSSFRQALPTGGDISVGLNTTRNSTSSLFSQLNPNYLSTLSFSVNQSLLKNRSIDPARRLIRIQSSRIELSSEELRKRTADVVTAVQRAYWDLVFALRDQQNRRANLDLSKQNLKQVEARIAAGTAAPLQKAEIEAELANRESDLLIAGQQLVAAENALKQLILGNPNDVAWRSTVIPTDRPSFSEEMFNLENALELAATNRPELRALRFSKAISETELDFAKNQAKPQIDLNANYSLIGLSGNIVGPPGGIPQQFAGGYGQSFSNLFKNETRVISGGLTITFPVRRGGVDADIATAELERQQVDARSRTQVQVISVEVRNAVKGVETAQQRVLSARRGRENAELQLEGERKLFEVGRSTQFLLFQRENALTNSRNIEIRAETDYNKALADYHRAVGTVLELNGITID
jgi:outer membrane protein